MIIAGRHEYDYAGMFLHQPSGLYLTANRPYDPYSGRWLSRDPSGEAEGTNLDGYVDQNPINEIDPFGLCGCGDDGDSGASQLDDAAAAAEGAAAAANLANAGRAIAAGGGVEDPIGDAIGAFFTGRAIGAGIIAGGDLLSGTAADAAARGNVADTQITQDYNNYASNERLNGRTPLDRNDWLRQNAGNYRPDQVKPTQKAWGDRRSRKC